VIGGLLSLVLVAGAPSLPAADALVAEFLAASGGVDRLRRLQTVRETGTITVTDPGHAASIGPALLEEKRPNKSRVERTVYGTRIAVAYDGHRAWILGATGKPQLAAGDMAQGLANNEFDHFLLDFSAKGTKVTTEALVDLPTGPAYKVRAELANGSVRYSYLDKRTFLELRRDYRETDGSSSVQWFGGHRRVGGLMRPTEYQMEYPSGRRIVTKVTPEIDTPIDDARFAFQEVR
jgi:hypothetical protein